MENIVGKNKIRNDLLNCLLKNWSKIDRKLIPDRLQLGTLEDGDFPLNLSRERKQILIEKNLEGIKEWINLVGDDYKKEEIYEKWKLNWFEKIRINNWNKNYKDKLGVQRPKTEFEKIVSQVRKGEIGITGLVGKICKIINLDSNSQTVMRSNWAKDLKIDISEQDWNINWNNRIMKAGTERLEN